MVHLFALLFAMLVWAVPAQAAVLFCEGWEGTNEEILARGWLPGSQHYEFFPDRDGADAGPFDLVTTNKWNGNQSLMFRYEGTQKDSPRRGGGASWFNYGKKPLNYTETWTTWYTRMEPGFEVAGGVHNKLNNINSVETKGLYQYMGSDKGQQHGWVYTYRLGVKVLNLQAQGIKGANYGTRIYSQNVQEFVQPDGHWVCYEGHIRLNTPGHKDGLFELYATDMTAGGPTILVSRWVDQEHVDIDDSGTDYTKSTHASSSWKSVSVYRQDGGPGSRMYYDDITVSTTRIGCSAPRSASAPASP
jgi:hypothetical protein